MRSVQHSSGLGRALPKTAFAHGAGAKPALWMSRLARVLKHVLQTGLLAKGARG